MMLRDRNPSACAWSLHRRSKLAHHEPWFRSYVQLNVDCGWLRQKWAVTVYHKIGKSVAAGAACGADQGPQGGGAQVGAPHGAVARRQDLLHHALRLQ